MDDSVREQHGVTRSGKPHVAIYETETQIVIDLETYSRLAISVAEAKMLRRGLSRLIRRIEGRVGA